MRPISARERLRGNVSSRFLKFMQLAQNVSPKFGCETATEYLTTYSPHPFEGA